MSIEVELNGKAGRVCPEGMAGTIRCPLIVRQTSEDVLTGNVFGHLKFIRPHLWLGPLLNRGLGTNRFRQVWHKNLSIRLWERQARFPPELLPFKEGRSEPDIIIEWENPKTTVWIEAKYGSGLAEGTANARDNDQVLRGIRTLLVSTGHLRPERLFHVEKRRAVWLALLNRKPEPVVDQYRDRGRLVSMLAGMGALESLPEEPFVGTVTWSDIAEALQRIRRQMTSTEAGVAETTIDYIHAKVRTAFSR